MMTIDANSFSLRDLRVPQPISLAAAFALALAATTAHASGFDHSHQTLTGVLKTVAADGIVDYAALQRDPAQLDNYLAGLAAVSEAEFGGWEQPEQLAFLINLYNAATLKLVADHYPVKSIKDIGSLLKSPWKLTVVDLFGKKVTLDHVEHERVRAGYDEPRAHFGLVCASVGCPPLRPEAFTASRLADQLDEQGRAFFADPTKNRVDARAGVLYLSQIFEWFEEDFTRDGKSLAEFAAPYFASPDDRQAALSGKLKVKFTRYDWSLNGR